MARHIYLHHRILAQPRGWHGLAAELVRRRDRIEASEGTLYGIWRSQIGRPRDELNVITTWPERTAGRRAMSACLASAAPVRRVEHWCMVPTLRPVEDEPPSAQGNYAFRYFETPASNWEEFLRLCAEAWPGFEASYDSQVIGLWRIEDDRGAVVKSLLLTRRPDLASWERSKLPRGSLEREVREKLSRRYDLCDFTVVSTSTLLTATDFEDRARWA